MKKIILSLAIVAAVGAIVVGGTIAYFSDTETSTGNTFTAGAIDLTIDNESYVTNNEGVLVASPNTSWTLSDITGQLFFNFTDLKPGDIGEDTISLHVNNNDAWACMSARITGTPENNVTEPESADDQTDGADEGELQDALNFAFWADDGDNVLEQDELEGPASQGIFTGTLKEFVDSSPRIIADSTFNIFTGKPGTPLAGGSEHYIGKAWCFGVLRTAAVVQDNLKTSGPLGGRGTGFTCDGSQLNNSTQTDGVIGDISFYVEQSRNNAGFTCAAYAPTYPTTRTLILEDKDASWDVIPNNTQGILTYNISGPTFTGTFDATGLVVNGEYSLVYYADKQDRFVDWGGDNPGALIGIFTADGSGNISSGAVNVDLGMDLPDASDWNANASPNYCDLANGFDDYNTCVGAKIWLVLSADYNSGTKELTAWNPSTYLFETDLINYNDTDI